MGHRPRPTFCITVAERDADRRLDKVLVKHLKAAFGDSVSRKRVKALLDRGSISLDGKRERYASTSVPLGARIDVFARRDEIVNEARILYEDHDLIAIDKPSGVRSQGTVADAHDNLFEAVRRFLRKRDGKDAYAGLHHRLDRWASGVMLLTRSKRANKGVAALFRERTADKTYRALCWAPEEMPTAGHSWRMEGPLRREGKKGRKDDGRYAESDLEVVEAYAEQGLQVEARPHTGRRHQVRLHCAMSDMPILGDWRYGPRGAPDGIEVRRLMLHARRLAFEHPITGASVEIESPLPEDFVDVRTQLRRASA